MKSDKLPMRKNPEGNNDFNCTRCVGDISIRALEGEGNERKFELSFSSEEAYERWYGTEILDHSAGCVNMDRLETLGVVLFNHKTDKVVGKVVKVWIEDNRGKSIIEFDDDTDADLIYKKVKGGTLKGVSVGYSVETWEEVASNKTSSDGRFTGPCFIAKRWTPLEISIVSVPADPTVGVGRSADFVCSPHDTVSGLSIYERTIQINQNRLKNL